jgi:hypothetical protein
MPTFSETIKLATAQPANIKIKPPPHSGTLNADIEAGNLNAGSSAGLTTGAG